MGGADKGPLPVPELALSPPGETGAVEFCEGAREEEVEMKVEVETEGETYIPAIPELDASSEPKDSEDGESVMMYCAVRCFRWHRLLTSSDTDTNAVKQYSSSL
jgi:hypothetical protein